MSTLIATYYTLCWLVSNIASDFPAAAKSLDET